MITGPMEEKKGQSLSERASISENKLMRKHTLKGKWPTAAASVRCYRPPTATVLFYSDPKTVFVSSAQVRQVLWRALIPLRVL